MAPGLLLAGVGEWKMSAVSMMRLVGVCGFATVLASGPGVLAAACTNPDGSCTTSITMSGAYAIRVHRTHPLSAPNAALTRAVIVLHGTNSNSGDYFSRMIRAADDEGVTEQTLIIAPTFLEAAELAQPGELYWLDGSGSSWERGDPTSTPGASVSSFDVMDRLISIVSDRATFPNLNVISVVGHSAGGQYVQRYAAGGQEPTLHADHGFVFVVANPSSYMYLDRRRPVSGSTTTFAIPSTTCRFNDYRYGMDYMNPYMDETPQATIIAQYRQRFVVYLAGEQDDDPTDPTLDTTCRAMAQGPHRLARALAYANYMDLYYPINVHQLLLVAGVGHSSTDMFRSPEGRSVIFIDPADIPGGSPPSTPQGLRAF